MDKLTAIAEAARVWRQEITPIVQVRKRLREEYKRRLEEAIESENRSRRETAARAIGAALDAGASKAALYQVTTKDYWAFEEYVNLARELGEKQAEG
jgi:hypothetical protein